MCIYCIGKRLHLVAGRQDEGRQVRRGLQLPRRKVSDGGGTQARDPAGAEQRQASKEGPVHAERRARAAPVGDGQERESGELSHHGQGRPCPAPLGGF